MKIPVIILLAFALSSCCNSGPQSVVALKIKYPNLSSATSVNAVRTDKDNLSVILDTISLGELNQSNAFSTLIQIEENSPNYIIYVENTTYIDTISDINYDIKGCKKKVKNFEYKFNGKIHTETELTIN